MSKWQISRPLLLEQLETRSLFAADWLHFAYEPNHATREFSPLSSIDLRFGEFGQRPTEPRDFGRAEISPDIRKEPGRGGESASSIPGREKTMDKWGATEAVVSVPTIAPSITTILFMTKPVATQQPAKWDNPTQSMLTLGSEGSSFRSSASLVPTKGASLSTLTLIVQASSVGGRLVNSSALISDAADSSSRGTGSSNAIARPSDSFTAGAGDVDRLRASSAAAGRDAVERTLPMNSIAAQPLAPRAGIAGTFSIPAIANDAFANASSHREYLPRDFKLSTAGLDSDSLGQLRHMPHNTEVEDPWELRSSTLRDLRGLTLQTEQAAATDAAIAMWFDGRGGLIDLSPGSGSLLRPKVVDQVIEVGLEALVGHHRALELMAASTEQPKDNDEVRLAVLQAIARANRDTAPISGDSDNLKPSFGVTGMAILAGTAALAARRKRPNSFLSKHLLNAEQQ